MTRRRQFIRLIGECADMRTQVAPLTDVSLGLLVVVGENNDLINLFPPLVATPTVYASPASRHQAWTSHCPSRPPGKSCRRRPGVLFESSAS